MSRAKNADRNPRRTAARARVGPRPDVPPGSAAPPARRLAHALRVLMGWALGGAPRGAGRAVGRRRRAPTPAALVLAVRRRGLRQRVRAGRLLQALAEREPDAARRALFARLASLAMRRARLEALRLRVPLSLVEERPLDRVWRGLLVRLGPTWALRWLEAETAADGRRRLATVRRIRADRRPAAGYGTGHAGGPDGRGGRGRDG
jgi:hypothetical protein